MARAPGKLFASPPRAPSGAAAPASSSAAVAHHGRRRKGWIAALALALMCCPARPALAMRAAPAHLFVEPDPIVMVRAAAREAVADDDWQRARAIAERWAELEPDLDYPWILMAWCHAHEGNFRAVVESYGKALTRNPDQRYQIWRSLGLAYSAIGHFDQALVALRRAAQLNSHDARLWRELCDTQLKLGAADAAADAADRALALESEYAEAWACYGRALALQQRDLEAVDALRRALDGRMQEWGTSRAMLWIALGGLYRRLHHAEGMEEVLQGLQHDDPRAAERFRDEMLRP